MSKKPEPKKPSSEDIKALIAKLEATLPGIEDAAAEAADQALDDPTLQPASISAARQVEDAKLQLAQLGRALQRAETREAEKLAAAQAKVRQEALAAIATDRRLLSRQALELAVRFERFVDQWDRLLKTAAHTKSICLPEHQTHGSAYASLSPHRVREAVLREMWRQGGVGTAGQVMNDGAFRSFACPGAHEIPPGLSHMTQKSNPAATQSLEAYFENLFDELLNRPMQRPASVYYDPAGRMPPIGLNVIAEENPLQAPPVHVPAPTPPK